MISNEIDWEEEAKHWKGMHEVSVKRANRLTRMVTTMTVDLARYLGMSDTSTHAEVCAELQRVAAEDER